MTPASIDIHQHFWPPELIEALLSRTTVPYLDGDVLHLLEGAYAFDVGEHDLEWRIGLLDGSGIEIAAVSLQATLGFDLIDRSERNELVSAWERGMLEVASATGGRLAPLAVGRPREGFAGVSVGASDLDDLDALAPTLDAMQGAGFLFVHPVACVAPPGAAAWWPAVVAYTSQMQRAYFAWLAHGQERWPDVNIVFAIMAGGGPIQLERLATRGVDVRSTLHSNVFFDTASYGRRALELCIQTFGVEQLVFGTDAPVVDPAHAASALDSFGESVARLVRQDVPSRILP